MEGDFVFQGGGGGGYYFVNFSKLGFMIFNFFFEISFIII